MRLSRWPYAALLHTLVVVLAACVLSATGPVWAADWQGLTPGDTRREEVLARFGEPARSVNLKDREVVAYWGSRAIKNTKRVQIRINRASQLVERIDVYPNTVIQQATVESTFGPRCAPKAQDKSGCYQAKLTTDNRTLFVYAEEGLTVAFSRAGNVVEHFTYLPNPNPNPTATHAASAADSSPTSAFPGEGGQAAGSEPWPPPSGAGPAGASGSATGAEVDALLADKFSVGGLLRLEGNTTAAQPDTGELAFQNTSFPMLLDLYFDGRPSDRVRGMMVGRLVYDPALNRAPAEAPVEPEALTANPQLQLDQLWLKFDYERTLYFTVGRQHAKWGVGRIWNTLDFLMANPRDPLVLFDRRLGSDMFRVALPLPELGLNLQAAAFVDAPLTTGVSPPLRLGAAVRGEWVVGATELALSARTQRDQKPQYGFDVSSALGPIDGYLELSLSRDGDRRLWTREADSSSGALSFTEAPLPAWIPQVVVGGDWVREFGEARSLTLNVEGYYNRLGYTDGAVLPWLVVQGEYRPLFAGRLYSAASATWTDATGAAGSGGSSNWTLLLMGNLSDGSYLARVVHGRPLLSDITLDLYAQVPFGRRGGELRFEGALPHRALNPGGGTGTTQVALPLVSVGAIFSLKI